MKEKKKAPKPDHKNSSTYKTKEDFLRWYYKQDRRKKKSNKDESSRLKY
ncbi:hypothetical protein [Candidatus Leptofilum sp.]